MRTVDVPRHAAKLQGLVSVETKEFIRVKRLSKKAATAARVA